MEQKTSKAKLGTSVVKLDELLGRVKKNKAQVFGKFPEKRAALILRAALVQLGKELGAAKEGIIKVQGLGNFRVSQVEREKEGRKVTVRKVLFKVAAPGPKKEKAG